MTKRNDFSYDNVVSGLRLMLWGYFKKIIIANNLAIFVEPIFISPRDYPISVLLLSIYFLAFQLYADCSGYTDIVRGIARLFGYIITENFRFPYLPKSIPEFWTRWHLTLSTWLRDYLFLPLSFFISRKLKRASVLFINSNLVIYISSTLLTFSIAGIWHGFSLTFILWGLLHGIYLSMSNLTRIIRKKLRKKISYYTRYPKLMASVHMIFSFHLVAFSWILFRAQSIKDAMYIIRKIIPSRTMFDFTFFIER